MPIACHSGSDPLSATTAAVGDPLSAMGGGNVVNDPLSAMGGGGAGTSAAAQVSNVGVARRGAAVAAEDDFTTEELFAMAQSGELHGDVSTFVPWSARKQGILSKYTTSEALSITTSFLSSQVRRKKMGCRVLRAR